jgi:hypothetical protein
MGYDRRLKRIAGQIKYNKMKKRLFTRLPELRGTIDHGTFYEYGRHGYQEIDKKDWINNFVSLVGRDFKPVIRYVDKNHSLPDLSRRGTQGFADLINLLLVATQTVTGVVGLG